MSKNNILLLNTIKNFSIDIIETMKFILETDDENLIREFFILFESHFYNILKFVEINEDTAKMLIRMYSPILKPIKGEKAYYLYVPYLIMLFYKDNKYEILIDGNARFEYFTWPS